MQTDYSTPKIPDKANTNKVLNDLRDLFKPILAKLSKNQRKTLAEIDQHTFPLNNQKPSFSELIDNSILVDTPPKRNNNKQSDNFDNLFRIPLNHKDQSQIYKGEYDEELYY